MRARIVSGLFLAMVSFGGSARASESDAGTETYWVDYKAPPDGDGSEAHPYRSLTQALKRKGRKRVRLAPGIYRGAFELLGDTELWGPGGESQPGAATEAVTPRGTAVLVSMGLRPVLNADGPAVVRGLRFRGIRGGGPAIWLRTGGLQLVDVQVEGMGGKGLVLDPQSSAHLERVAFRGSYSRAIELNGATLEGTDVRLDGDTGLHALRSRVELLRLQVTPGSGPGLFCAGTELKLREATIRGHEYGLLSRTGCKLDVQGLWSDKPQRAGIALVESEGYITDLKVTESGSYGGIQLLSSNIRIDRFELLGGEAYGVTIRGGSVKLRSGTIRDIRDREGGAGDGIHVRTAELELRAISMTGIAGAGVLAAEEARVEARELLLRKVMTSGIWADTGARVRVDAGKFESLGGQVVTIPARAWVKLVGAELHGLGERPIVMDCQLGARLELSRLSGEPLGPLPSCVH